jgi:hypothetical protein
VTDSTLPALVEPDRPAGLTPAVEHACLALASGDADTITSAASLAGISHQALSQALRKPAVLAFLNARMSEQRVMDRLQARRVLRFLASSARSQYVSLEAAKHMDRDEAQSIGAAGISIRIDLG